MRSNRFFLFGIVTIVLAASAHAVETAKPSWLFVMTGQVESVNTGEIVINAHPKVVAFTDRPDRLVKAAALETFVDETWNAGSDSFAKNPPNAALVFEDAQVEIEELTLVSRSGNTVSFSTKKLSGGLPKPGDQIALVIDIF